MISIHALREEGDIKFERISSQQSYFYPRPPRGGRRPGHLPQELHLSISIHALREEGDRSPADACHTIGNFYPRPPRGGRQSTRLL